MSPRPQGGGSRPAPQHPRWFLEPGGARPPERGGLEHGGQWWRLLLPRRGGVLFQLKMASSGSIVEHGGKETTSGDGLRDGSGGEQLGAETLTAARPPPPFKGYACDDGPAQGRCSALPPLPCACRLDQAGPKMKMAFLWPGFLSVLFIFQH